MVIVRTPDPDEGREEGRKRRDKAMAQVDANAKEEWKKKAVSAIYRVANRNPDRFTGDDFWDELVGQKVAEPHERRAMGPVVRRILGTGDIVKIDYEPSRRPERHCGPVAVYRKA